MCLTANTKGGKIAGSFDRFLPAFILHRSDAAVMQANHETCWCCSSQACVMQAVMLVGAICLPAQALGPAVGDCEWANSWHILAVPHGAMPVAC